MDYGISDEDRKRQAWEALMAAGFGLLGTQKGQEMQGLGRAGLLGLGTYNQGLRDVRRDNLAAAAEKRSAQTYDMQAAQFAQQQAQWAEQQRQQAAMRQAQQGAIIPGQQAMPAMGPPTATGEVQPPVMAQAPGFDFSKYAQNLAPIAPDKALALQQQLAKPTKELKDTKTLMQDGRRVTVNFYKDGTHEILPFAPDAEKLMQISAGGVTRLADPFTGADAAAPVQHTQTYADQVAAARLRLEQEAAQRAKAGEGKPQFVNGQWVYPPSQQSPTGQAVTPAGLVKPPKDLTESQAKAAAYVTLMDASNKVFNELAAGGFTGETKGNQAQLAMAGTQGIPYVPGSAALPRSLASDAAQKFNQAELQWTEAGLRFTTGATAPPEEVVRMANTFFPRPGDSAAKVQQKAEMRNKMEEAVRMAAGSGGAGAPDKAADGKPKLTKLATENMTAKVMTERILKEGDPDKIKRLRVLGYIE